MREARRRKGAPVGRRRDLGKAVGIEQGMRFAIREGGKIVGAGLVTDAIA